MPAAPQTQVVLGCSCRPAFASRVLQVKNTQVTVAFHAALEAIANAGCLTLAEACEAATPGATAPNPLVQTCALKWLKATAAATVRAPCSVSIRRHLRIMPPSLPLLACLLAPR